MVAKDYFLASVRLASFRPQRRSSVAGGGGKATKWPHKNMAPKRFVEAGFYFDPSPDHDDNVTCYLCLKSLDGWEAGDDPVAEHIRHSESCGWAVTAATQDIPPSQHGSDPHSEQFRQARLMTFGRDRWPHGDGDNLSIANMANAGFHYAPTKNEADYCLCPFCGVSLANFEPEDDPRYEHEKRAPACYFFTSEATKKSSRRPPRTSAVPKKQQPRRASRATSVLELPVPEPGGDTTEDDEPRKGKRSSSVKPKAPVAKAKKGAGGRKQAAPPESAESTHSLSGAEDAPPRKGRKRPSAAISDGPVPRPDGRAGTDEDNEIVVQPKKRATRASMAQQSSVDPLPPSHPDPPKRQRTTRASIARTTKQEAEREMSLTDAEDAVECRPKKGRRAASKSKPPTVKPIHRTYMAADEDLDHALELDLERPLTDEDEPGIHTKPFVRSTTKPLTRSQASLAVEQQMNGAPSDTLIHTTARKPKPAPGGGGMATPLGKTPLRPFFKDEDQDFSMPVRVPAHLSRDVEVLDQHGAAPSDLEAGEEPVSPPVHRGARGRHPPKPSALQPKAAARKDPWSTRSRSNTVESGIHDDPVAETAHSPPPPPTQPQHEPPEPAARPKRGAKKQYRESAVSLASTIPDYAPDRHEAGAAIEDIPTEDELSGSRGVVRHRVEVRDSFAMQTGAVSSDGPLGPEEGGPAPRSSPAARSKGTSRRDDTPAHDRYTIPSSPFRERPSPLPGTVRMDLDDPSDEPELPGAIAGDETPRPPLAPTHPEDPCDEHLPPQLRSPLSPIRKQLRVPLQSTPRSKPMRILQTSHPWIPIDLDVVFPAPNSSSLGDTGEGGLTAAEREMTVEDWIKWKAACGQRRLNEQAEKLIGILESKGKEARMAIEGIPTV